MKPEGWHGPENEHGGCYACGSKEDKILISVYTTIKKVTSSYALCKKCIPK